MDIFNVHLLTSEQKQKAREAVVELGLRLKGLEDQAAQFLVPSTSRLGSGR